MQTLFAKKKGLLRTLKNRMQTARLKTGPGLPARMRLLVNRRPKIDVWKSGSQICAGDYLSKKSYPYVTQQVFGKVFGQPDSMRLMGK